MWRAWCGPGWSPGVGEHDYLPGLIRKLSCPCGWCKEPGVGGAGPLGWETYKHEYLPSLISKPYKHAPVGDVKSTGCTGLVPWGGRPIRMNTYPVLSASPAAPVGDVKSLVWAGLVPWGGSPISTNTYPVLSASPAAPVGDVKSRVWAGLVPWGGSPPMLVVGTGLMGLTWPRYPGDWSPLRGLWGFEAWLATGVWVVSFCKRWK